MIVELMAGMWTGADFCGLNDQKNWENIFIIFSPDMFSSKEI